MTRTERQTLSIDRWRDIGKGRGTLECYTGFGKTRIALMAIVRLKKAGKVSRVLVLVPTIHLMKKWKQDLLNYGIGFGEVKVVNTQRNEIIKSDKEFEYDLLILDEVHNYINNSYSVVWNNIKYKYLLALSATIPSELENDYFFRVVSPIVDKITIKEGMDNGWVPTLKVFNFGIELSKETKEKYDKVNKEFSSAFAFFGNNFELVNKCMKSNEEAKRWASIRKVSFEMVKGQAYKWATKMRLRKQLINNADDKLIIAQELLHIFGNDKNNKIIVFNQNIEMAEKILYICGDKCRIYHSKIPKKTNAYENLKYDIENNNANIISAVTGLDEGLDIPNLNMAITISGTSKKKQGTQRHGRLFRFEEGKTAIHIEIYLKGTNEVYTIKSRQEGIPKSCIKYVDSVDDILENLKT